MDSIQQHVARSFRWLEELLHGGWVTARVLSTLIGCVRGAIHLRLDVGKVSVIELLRLCV